MDEELYRTYRKEEEFAERFRSSAWTASRLLEGVWKPNRWCDNIVRQNRKLLLSAGQQSDLVFTSAAVYHDPTTGFLTSIEILLESSIRIVNVRVNKKGDKLRAEKIVDRTQKPTCALVA